MQNVMLRDLLVSLSSLCQRNRALISTTLASPPPCVFAWLLLRHRHLLRVWHRCTRWGYWPEHLVCHWHERLVLAACNRACAWRWCCRKGGEADPIQCTQAQVRMQVLFNGGGSPCQRFVDCRVQQDKPCQGLVLSLVKAWCFRCRHHFKRDAGTLNPKALKQGAGYRLRSLLRGATHCDNREHRVTSNSRRSPSISRRRCEFVLASSAQRAVPAKVMPVS